MTRDTPETTGRPAGFDPTRHLMKVKGRDYLEVKWRLVWLRDQHPDAAIETQHITLSSEMAVFRATVTLPPRQVDSTSGEVMWSGSATGYGMAERSEFEDYMEKAETKALGRALAALGFGTQFTGPEIDEGRVVDTPADRGPRQGSGQRSNNRPQGDGGNAREPGITDPQRRKILALGHHVYELNEVQVNEWVAGHFNGDTLATLSRRDASNLISAWEADANK